VAAVVAVTVAVGDTGGPPASQAGSQAARSLALARPSRVIRWRWSLRPEGKATYLTP
jgi:hypothetical protein